MIIRTLMPSSLVLSALLLTSFTSHTAQARGEAHVEKITNNITVLRAGSSLSSNISVFSGDDGLFVADTGVARSREKVLAAVKAVSDKPVRFVVNTHWHFDHVGNNEGFHAPAHDSNAVVIAHKNVRKRMIQGQYIPVLDRTTQPATHNALPVITYDSRSENSPTTVHFNGEDLRIYAVDPAHTDGDSFVFWPTSNVIHAGDLFFNGIWPIIDASSGGNIDGVIKATNKILALSNNRTKIIPGHGPIANKADLENYQAMLKIVAERAKAAKAQGKSIKNWTAENPLKDLEKKWGDGFLTTEKFIKAVWQGL